MRASLVLFAALIAVAYAAGQYYVPRSYYIIDSDGHETAPVPLRRLRRSLVPRISAGVYPGRYPGGGNADATANSNAPGCGNAIAIANASSGRGMPGPKGYDVQHLRLGASRPKTGDFTRSQSGTVSGPSVVARTNVVVDSSGHGYYDQEASVLH